MKEASLNEEEPPGSGSIDICRYESRVSSTPRQKPHRVSTHNRIKGFYEKETIKGRFWPDSGQGKWSDWKWQYANRFRSLESLASLPGLSTIDADAYGELIGRFHYSITPYYMSLIDWSKPGDPIRKQCVPDMRELSGNYAADDDPLEEEEDMPVKGLVHRYPDRVLVIATSACAMYCRHCTRKRLWRDGERSASKSELAAMVSYVKSTPAVREVIVSGGDPLTMNIEILDWLLGEFRMIPHVEVLRIGTRVPVVMPMRITEELARMLKKHRPLWLNTQFNHPNEITPEAQEACDTLLTAGIPVSNQSVLLKGINDSAEVMKALCHSLQRIMVRPYYLYQCDPVVGVEHFRTNIWKGIEIIEMMRGHTGGLSVPTFVIDAPGGGGKIPLQPFYLLSASEDEILLRNYEGIIIKYRNPSETMNEPAKFHSGLNGAYLDKYVNKPAIPDGVPRYLRRKEKQMQGNND